MGEHIYKVTVREHGHNMVDLNGNPEWGFADITGPIRVPYIYSKEKDLLFEGRDDRVNFFVLDDGERQNKLERLAARKPTVGVIDIPEDKQGQYESLLAKVETLKKASELKEQALEPRNNSWYELETAVSATYDALNKSVGYEYPAPPRPLIQLLPQEKARKLIAELDKIKDAENMPQNITRGQYTELLGLRAYLQAAYTVFKELDKHNDEMKDLFETTQFDILELLDELFNPPEPPMTCKDLRELVRSLNNVFPFSHASH